MQPSAPGGGGGRSQKRGHEAAEDLRNRAAGFGSRKPSGVVCSAPVFLVHTREPKEWRLVINLRRHNAMLEDSTKALASQIFSSLMTSGQSSKRVNSNGQVGAGTMHSTGGGQEAHFGQH